MRSTSPIVRKNLRQPKFISNIDVPNLPYFCSFPISFYSRLSMCFCVFYSVAYSSFQPLYSRENVIENQGREEVSGDVGDILFVSLYFLWWLAFRFLPVVVVVSDVARSSVSLSHLSKLNGFFLRVVHLCQRPLCMCVYDDVINHCCSSV